MRRGLIKSWGRKIYRTFRHPKHRRPGGGRLRGWVGEHVFVREMWRPCEQSMARAVGLGLLVAVLPVPGQMLLAGGMAVWMTRRWEVTVNLPTAVALTWANNAVTVAPILYAQRALGVWVVDGLGLAPWPVFPVAQPVVVGVMVTALVLPATGYLAVVGLWEGVLRHLFRGLATERRAGVRRPTAVSPGS